MDGAHLGPRPRAVRDGAQRARRPCEMRGGAALQRVGGGDRGRGRDRARVGEQSDPPGGLARLPGRPSAFEMRRPLASSARLQWRPLTARRVLPGGGGALRRRRPPRRFPTKPRQRGSRRDRCLLGHALPQEQRHDSLAPEPTTGVRLPGDQRVARFRHRAVHGLRGGGHHALGNLN